MIYFQRADRLGRILSADLGAGIIMVDLRGAPAVAAFDRLINGLAEGILVETSLGRGLEIVPGIVQE
jgi:hypothetical protein